MDFKSREKKWQDRWAQAEVFKAELNSAKPKYYALDMFPYPSGVGLHIGHIASYTPTDIVSRYKRAQGFNVLHPIGYDAFGLPAEQYAIKTGIHPAETTEKAILNFRRQLQTFGFSYDWSREVSTCTPQYYKWTQFIFLKLWEKGLAYQKEVAVNWCPELKTVLANEEVVEGKSERGGHPVIRVPMKQWMLKITAYAERLLADLDKVDWPAKTKEGQRNWIGKSVGHLVNFSIQGQSLEVFTTRIETLYGVTSVILAPEHPRVAQIVTSDQQGAVAEYQQQIQKQLEVDRKGSEISGVFTGAYAEHPLTKELLPVWISNYVLGDYGQGAVMAVPAHDERDFKFAQKYELAIKPVWAGTDFPILTGSGLINSPLVNGLSSREAAQKLGEDLTQAGQGRPYVEYKLRDWLFSRQRYWGEPFPLIHYPAKGLQAVAVTDLPVLLPTVADYEPAADGKAPLAKNDEWVNYQGGRRETDTMPGSAGSSWYFLRFTDPHNDQAPFDYDCQKYWMPVDLYVGGPEHTVGHLLYARFWQKVLFDAGLVSHDEPFKKLAHQGMILGADGQKISKSRGNVIDLDKIYQSYGADVLRTYISFLGPLDRDKPWSDKNIEGIKRFFQRIEKLVATTSTGSPLSEVAQRALHQTVKKVTEDIENLSFNTAIAQLMSLVNVFYEQQTRNREAIKILVQLLAPFAPHLAEDLWEQLGESTWLVHTPWPVANLQWTHTAEVSIGVQINGKTRGSIVVTPTTSEAEAVAQAQAAPELQSLIRGRSLKKVIYRPAKILNLILD